jgi:hypothetical protein
MARTKSLAGGCLCGAVRYRVTGKPVNTMICHCETCRRAAGAPVVAWLTFPASRLRITKGKPVGFRSTAPVLRTFCGACGTPLTYAHKKSPKTIDVTTCSLDAPDAFPPTHHSWLSDDVAWVRFGDRLPAFPRFRPKSST